MRHRPPKDPNPRSFPSAFKSYYPTQGLHLGKPLLPTVIPDNVAGLVATSGNSEVILTWSPAANAQTYKVYRSTSSPVTTADTLVVEKAGTGYTDTGRTNGTEYFYAVLASNVIGDAAGLSNEDSATPFITNPAAVFATSQNSTTEYDVTWPDVTGATSYNLYTSTSSPVTGLDPKTTLVTSPHTETGISNGTPYYNRITAQDAAGESDVDTAPEVAIVSLAAVNDLAVAQGDTQVTLTWTEDVTNADAYDVYRSTSTPVTTGDLHASDVNTGYTDTGLTNGTTYYYAVRARNTSVGAGSQSSLSNEVNETPEISTPTGLTTAWADGEVSVSFGAVTGATNYRLHRDTVSPVTAGDAIVAQGAATTLTDSTPVNGTQYFYAVTAQDAATTSDISATVDETPLAPPSGVSASPGDTEVDVSWTNPVGATAADIYFGTSSGVTKLTGTKITGVTSPYTHTGRTNGTTYYYVVVARNATGETDESSEVSATPAEAAGLPRTATTVLTGRTASYIWMLEEASGNITDEIASEVLTQGGTAPTYEVSGSPDFPDDKGIAIADAANTNFAAGASTLFDLGASSSWAFMWVAKNNASVGGDRNLTWKLSGSTGHLIRQLSNNKLRVFYGDGTLVNTTTVNGYGSSDWYVGCMVIDRNTDLMKILAEDGTNDDEVTLDISARGSSGNAVTFKIGSSGSTNGVPKDILAVYVFEGTDAEGIALSDLETFWTTYGP